ncbi:unnamed protein product [Boreogadus saida]
MDQRKCPFYTRYPCGVALFSLRVDAGRTRPGRCGSHETKSSMSTEPRQGGRRLIRSPAEGEQSALNPQLGPGLRLPEPFVARSNSVRGLEDS